MFYFLVLISLFSLNPWFQVASSSLDKDGEIAPCPPYCPSPTDPPRVHIDLNGRPEPPRSPPPWPIRTARIRGKRWTRTALRTLGRV